MASWAVSTLSGSDSDTEDAGPSAPAPEASSQETAKPQGAQAAAAPEPPSKPEPAQALQPDLRKRELLPEEPTSRAPPPKLPVPPPSPMEARMEAKKQEEAAAAAAASAPAKVINAPSAMAVRYHNICKCPSTPAHRLCKRITGGAQEPQQKQGPAPEPELQPKPQKPDWAPAEDGLLAWRRREQPAERRAQPPPAPAAAGGSLGPGDPPPELELPGQVGRCCRHVVHSLVAGQRLRSMTQSSKITVTGRT